MRKGINGFMKLHNIQQKELINNLYKEIVHV